MVLDLLGSDLDLRAWVLSPTGRRDRRLAAAGHRAARRRSAPSSPAEHLAAARAGRRGPHRVDASDGGRRTPSSRSARRARPRARPGDVRATVLSDWLLAVEADAGDWPAERLDLLARASPS